MDTIASQAVIPADLAPARPSSVVNAEQTAQTHSVLPHIYLNTQQGITLISTAHKN